MNDLIVARPLGSELIAVAGRVFPWMFLCDTIYKESSGQARALLDIGCGRGEHVKELKRMGRKFQVTYLVGADIWLPYLTVAKKVFHDVIRCDIRRLPFRFSSFDIVIATDVLEHVGKGEGCWLLEEIENITRGQAFVFTPVGYNVKKTIEDNNPWQAHRSGWRAKELEARGYEVFGMNGARFLYKERGTYRISSLCLRPVMVMIRLLSTLLTLHFAEGAYRMLCIRNKPPERSAPAHVKAGDSTARAV